MGDAGLSVDSSPRHPTLQRSENGGHTVVVDGEPFLILGAELHNSSFSCADYMRDVWPRLKSWNVNTLLAAVSWDVIEPREGIFDFDIVDRGIREASSHGFRLILTWFGAFKNAKSTYAPAWVKTDSVRFPRAELRKQNGTSAPTDALSIFAPQLVQSSARAFSRLLAHIRDMDQDRSTVLMVQVENEVGILGDSRDACPEANRVYNSAVPSALLEKLRSEWDRLHPKLRAFCTDIGETEHGRAGGGWTEVFGDSLRTDELFMAYHFARYVEEVAKAGKREYALPMYTNVWQNYGDEDADRTLPVIVGGGGRPGDYPSGGGVIEVLDVWQLFAPTLDFVAPDLYLNDYAAVCAKYRHRGQALFIPEQRRDEYGARRIWLAYGTYGALCTAPFGIDSLLEHESPWKTHYRILQHASAFVLAAQRKPGTSIGFCFDEVSGDDCMPDRVINTTLGGWLLTIARSHVFGRPGPGFGMVIQLAQNRFLLLGEGFEVAFAKDGGAFTGILWMREKLHVAGSDQLANGRWLNGDETRSGAAAVMPTREIDYGRFPICINVPARTGMAECEVYSIE